MPGFAWALPKDFKDTSFLLFQVNLGEGGTKVTLQRLGSKFGWSCAIEVSITLSAGSLCAGPLDGQLLFLCRICLNTPDKW